jgi:hypothetical protein
MPPRKKTTATDEETPVKAKREKRSSKHKVVAVITPDGIQGGFQSEMKRPLIAHLPIKSSEIKFHDQLYVYDPNPPAQFEAFDAAELDPFFETSNYEPVPDSETTIQMKQNVLVEEKKPSHQQTQSQPQPQPQAQVQAPMRKEYGPTKLLVQFGNTQHTQELPTETDLACFWCCDSFKGRPCVVPLKIVDNVWQVYGNFCTPQCCMAHLLAENVDTHTRWERIALLNCLYKDSVNGRIYPAPNRECLQRFGGPISIQEFRGICESQRIRVDVHLPPMVSILASMDTKPIDFYETTIRNTVVNPYQYSLPKVEDTPQSLKLKRNKPLKDKENTLDSCLNIMVKS